MSLRTFMIHERGQNINMSRNLEEVIPTFTDDLQGLQTSEEEVTVDVVEIARELELEVEPEGGTGLLQSHHKNLTDEELLPMDEQKSGFLRWNLLLVKML